MSADKGGGGGGGPRDWDKELAQIDKLIAQGKTEPPPLKDAQTRGRADAPEGQSASARLRVGASGLRHTPLFTWIRLLLALGLGVGMASWPYTHGCGAGLLAYMAGVGAVIVASFWTMVSSWKSRSAIAHFLSITLLFWGTVLAAREILPRTGYAKERASWRCHAQAPNSPISPISPISPN